jgi:acetylornithine deacetylase
MDAVSLAQQMIAINSVSNHSNAAIAALMRGWLEELGFEIEQLEFIDPNGERKVSLVAKRGSGRGGIAYFCHNDVVPVDDWNATAGGPFSGAIRDGRLWGRGACDMKGSAAAALAAIARIDATRQIAPIYFVATSDEEQGMHGARLVSERSRLFEEMVGGGTVGIIGEPTELKIVNAHKGGCHVMVTSRGRTAHSSTADGLNANWQLIDFLSYAKQVQQRCESEPALQNAAFDPPTLSMNLVIKNRPAAYNVTVGLATCQIFLRPMPDVPWEAVVEDLRTTAEKMGLEVAPVLKMPPVFTAANQPLVQAALELTGAREPSTVSYATDGCWFTRLKDLIVVGPGSIEQAHRPDEWLSLGELDRGVDLFQRFFERYALPAGQAGATELPQPRLAQAQGSQASARQPQLAATSVALDQEKRISAELNEAHITPAETKIHFRRAALDDVPAVNELLRPFVNERKLLRRTRAEMDSLVPSGFLAQVDGRVIGFSAVEIYSRKLAEIQCLAVDAAFQGHGIGSELVRRCIELARERGVMEVLAISSSDSFLQKLGFNYSLPDQKRALFCQLRSRDQMYTSDDDEPAQPGS